MSAALVVRPWVALVRLPAVFSVWSNVFAAHLIGTGGTPLWGLLAIQLGITTTVYWAGMILNDCFDLDEDRRERPERPLPSGRIAPKAAWTAASALLVAALLLAAVAGTRIFWITLALIAAVLLYDGLLKHGPLGPLAMGLCRYLNWLMALAVVPVMGTGLMLLPLPVLLYTMALTHLSRGETGRDMHRAIQFASLWLATAALTITGLHLAQVQPQPIALLALLLALALLGVRLWRLHAEPSAKAVRGEVGVLLLGMILLDALLLAGDGQWAAAALLLPLAIAGRLLARGLSVT